MLTRKQSDVLDIIKTNIQANGYAPSYEEIAKAIGTSSKGSVSKHITALVEKGYISKNANVGRSIELQGAANDSSIPFIGRIAAGKPLEAFENPDRIDLNYYLNAGADCYILEVHGESMRDCGILDGDLVLIRSAQTARNGQIVVALVDDYEATLKRFRRNTDQTITLIPENIEMEPMHYPAARVSVQGVLIAQIRKY